MLVVVRDLRGNRPVSWSSRPRCEAGRDFDTVGTRSPVQGKAAKRFIVNFFSTDGQYDKEKAAAKQPKKKMRPNPLDKARARAARS